MIRRGRTTRRSEVPTSSMADIAFLLLVFFLVSTIFDEERGLELVLPESQPVEVSPTKVLFLAIREDGMVAVQHGESPERVMRAADVASLWRMEAEREAGLIASVRTEGAAPYRFMIDVLDALRSAGAERISLSVAEGTTSR